MSVRLNPGASAVDMAAFGCTYYSGIWGLYRVKVSAYTVYNIHSTLVSDSTPSIRELIICMGYLFLSHFMHLMATFSDGDKFCNTGYL